MWSLKSLPMLKCESSTSLHAVQYRWQPNSDLMFCSYHFKKPGFVFSLFLIFFAKIKPFVLIKSFLYKKRVNKGSLVYVYECNVNNAISFQITLEALWLTKALLLLVISTKTKENNMYISTILIPPTKVRMMLILKLVGLL